MQHSWRHWFSHRC